MTSSAASPPRDPAPPAAIRPPVKVLYIAGAGRSGSTLLDRVLGAHPGFFSCGELQYLWSSGYAENQLCSCGEPLRSCSFWGAVLDGMLRDGVIAGVEDTAALVMRCGMRRHIPQLRFSTLRTRRYKADLARLLQITQALYRRAADLSGAEWLVDSSLDPSHAMVLALCPEIDLRVIHLLRDPRAVAHSRQRRKARPEISTRYIEMEIQSPILATIKWSMVNNLIAQSRRNKQYLQIWYEDFCRLPSKVLLAIFCFLNHKENSLIDQDNSLEIPPLHTTLGNPFKFSNGAITIQLDSAWQTTMPYRDKLLARSLSRMLTLPSILRRSHLERKFRSC